MQDTNKEKMDIITLIYNALVKSLSELIKTQSKPSCCFDEEIVYNYYKTIINDNHLYKQLITYNSKTDEFRIALEFAINFINNNNININTYYSGKNLECTIMYTKDLNSTFYLYFNWKN